MQIPTNVRRGIGVVLAGLAVAVTVLALGIGGLVAVGRWWQPTSAASHEDPSAPASTAADDTPARLEVARLVDEAAATGSATPMERRTTRRTDLDRCDPTAPALGAERTDSGPVGPVTLDVEIFGAGLGQRALETRASSADRCGASVTRAAGPGVSAVEGLQDGQWWVLWRRGDVVVRILAPPASAPEVRLQAAALDQRLGQDLAQVCPDQAAPSDAARRNPSQPDHGPYTVTEPVNPPADVAPPDPTALVRPLPATDAESTRQAAALTASPPAPAPPVAATVEVPSVDDTGPGCGWAFTGMTPPDTDPAEVARQAEAARAGATEALRRQWAAWPDTVARWQRLLVAYQLVQQARSAPLSTTTTATVPPPTSTAPATTAAPPPAPPPKAGPGKGHGKG